MTKRRWKRNGSGGGQKNNFTNTFFSNNGPCVHVFVWMHKRSLRQLFLWRVEIHSLSCVFLLFCLFFVPLIVQLSCFCICMWFPIISVVLLYWSEQGMTRQIHLLTSNSVSLLSYKRIKCRLNEKNKHITAGLCLCVNVFLILCVRECVWMCFDELHDVSEETEKRKQSPQLAIKIIFTFSACLCGSCFRRWHLCANKCWKQPLDFFTLMPVLLLSECAHNTHLGKCTHSLMYVWLSGGRALLARSGLRGRIINNGSAD